MEEQNRRTEEQKKKIEKSKNEDTEIRRQYSGYRRLIFWIK